ncbi:hypothetical protein DSO57_1010541 [Entomophthora muscae]|uniref:Uncharacterized protein n=1 Tax=Entomophthora muscae TaxID=34485 RepID=A0ACC2SVM6_9FUNG|nr:hypothetical protein DSO57_1010541 [Entomophthora muscae]
MIAIPTPANRALHLRTRQTARRELISDNPLAPPPPNSQHMIIPFAQPRSGHPVPRFSDPAVIGRLFQDAVKVRLVLHC